MAIRPALRTSSLRRAKMLDERFIALSGGKAAQPYLR